MTDRFGEELGRALLAGLDTPPSVSLRVNRRKLSLAGFSEEDMATLYSDMQPVSWAPGGFRLSERPLFTANPLLHAGGFYVQEAASMYLSRLIATHAPQRPLRILDLCAAPGGKSIATLEAAPEGSVLVANEVVSSRASALRENLIKWGVPDVAVISASASELGKSKVKFDLIIVDAPCSGEGMMRKEPTARTQWSENLVESCSSLQREILSDILPALLPGGQLVFSTCTFNSRENEDNVDWLVKEKGLKLLEPPRRFMPHIDGTEGLFISMFEAPEGEAEMEADSFSSSKRKQGRDRRQAKSLLTKEMEQRVRGWIDTERSDLELILTADNIEARSQRLSEVLVGLPEKVKYLSAGLSLATLKGRDLIPAHSLAVSLALNRRAFPEVELSEVEALRYLERKNPELPPRTPLGFILVTYHNVALGFVKNLGNRSNNLYPKEWRILRELSSGSHTVGE